MLFLCNVLHSAKKKLKGSKFGSKNSTEMNLKLSLLHCSQVLNEYLITMRKGKKMDNMRFSSDHRTDILTEALIFRHNFVGPIIDNLVSYIINSLTSVLCVLYFHKLFYVLQHNFSFLGVKGDSDTAISFLKISYFLFPRSLDDSFQTFTSSYDQLFS